MTDSYPNADSRFHVSLNVSNLERAVRFYRTLFACAPAKWHGDYAKFEIDQPPLVLALVPKHSAAGGVINHFGIRASDPSVLVAVQRRLEQEGYRTRRQDGVECCYAKQTKFWVADPDGTPWEIYVLEKDIDHHGAEGIPDEVMPASATAADRGPQCDCAV